MDKKPLILAIDDAPVNLHTLGAALSADYDFQFATSGQYGLMLAERNVPDLILLDIMMPDMDGYEVCRRIRHHEQLRLTPVVFVTALAESDAEAAGLELGAVDYLTKPYNVAIVRLRIRNILEREAMRRQIANRRNELEAKVAERTMSLSIAKEAAEAADRAKGTFLSNMNHEFRTPLNHIMGMAELARRRVDDEKTGRYLSRILQASQELLERISDVVEMAQLHADRLTLEPGEFTLDEIAHSLLARNRPDADRDKLFLSVELDAALQGMTWQGDRQRFEQIPQTLIHNAIRFTERGGIEVRIMKGVSLAEGTRILIEVTDTGIGVSPDARQRVFDAFEQQDPSSTRARSGTGLGLAICRALARKMGGDLELEDRPEGGSIFRAEVLLQSKGHAAAHRPAYSGCSAAERLRSHCRGASVLVLDPEGIGGEVAAFLLDDVGLRTQVVGDTAAAFAALAHQGFGWLLVNIDAVRVDAAEFVGAINALPGCQSLPVVAVTSDNYCEEIARYLRGGMAGYLTIPYDPDRLYEKLWSVSGRSAG